MDYMDVSKEKVAAAQGPLPLMRTLKDRALCCRCLAAAHALGMVHRDIAGEHSSRAGSSGPRNPEDTRFQIAVMQESSSTQVTSYLLTPSQVCLNSGKA